MDIQFVTGNPRRGSKKHRRSSKSKRKSHRKLSPAQLAAGFGGKEFKNPYLNKYKDRTPIIEFTTKEIQTLVDSLKEARAKKDKVATTKLRTIIRRAYDERRRLKSAPKSKKQGFLSRTKISDADAVSRFTPIKHDGTITPQMKERIIGEVRKLKAKEASGQKLTANETRLWGMYDAILQKPVKGASVAKKKKAAKKAAKKVSKKKAGKKKAAKKVSKRKKAGKKARKAAKKSAKKAARRGKRRGAKKAARRRKKHSRMITLGRKESIAGGIMGLKKGQTLVIKTAKGKRKYKRTNPTVRLNPMLKLHRNPVKLPLVGTLDLSLKGLTGHAPMEVVGMAGGGALHSLVNPLLAKIPGVSKLQAIHPLAAPALLGVLANLLAPKAPAAVRGHVEALAKGYMAATVMMAGMEIAKKAAPMIGLSGPADFGSVDFTRERGYGMIPAGLGGPADFGRVDFTPEMSGVEVLPRGEGNYGDVDDPMMDPVQEFALGIG